MELKSTKEVEVVVQKQNNNLQPGLIKILENILSHLGQNSDYHTGRFPLVNDIYASYLSKYLHEVIDFFELIRQRNITYRSISSFDITPNLIGTYSLYDDQVEQIFKNSIWPIISKNCKPSSHPVAQLVGAQQGSGKSTLINSINRNQNYIYINGDNYRIYHPEIDRILEIEGDNMPEATNKFILKIVELVILCCIENRIDVVLEGTFGKLSTIVNRLQTFKSAGYTTALDLLSVPPLLSKLGIFQRLITKLESGERSRYSLMTNHDISYNNIPSNLDSILSNRTDLVDVLVIFNRSGDILQCMVPNGINYPPNFVNYAIESIRKSENSQVVLEIVLKIVFDFEAKLKKYNRVLPHTELIYFILDLMSELKQKNNNKFKI